MENNRDLTLREFYKIYYERNNKKPFEKVKGVEKHMLIKQYEMYLKGMFTFK